jgi:hypothetical protein
MAPPEVRRARHRILILVVLTAIGASLVIGIFAYQAANDRWSWRNSPKRGQAPTPTAAASSVSEAPGVSETPLASSGIDLPASSAE